MTKLTRAEFLLNSLKYKKTSTRIQAEGHGDHDPLLEIKNFLCHPPGKFRWHQWVNLKEISDFFFYLHEGRLCFKRCPGRA